MALELTRKSWESHKAWTVTGKGLSAALDAFTVADAKCKATKEQEDFRDALGRIKAVGEEIDKNRAKLNKTLYKDTAKTLDELYALAKSRSDAIKKEAAKALKNEGARKIVAGAMKDIKAIQAFVASNDPATLVKKTKTRVDTFLKSALGKNKDEAAKFKKTLEDGDCGKWFKAQATAQNTAVNIKDQLKMVKCEDPAIMAEIPKLHKLVKDLVETSLEKPVTAMKKDLARLDIKGAKSK